MSYATVNVSPEDDRVKVNNITKARSLNITGYGETVVDDPTNNTIDITIPGAGITKGLYTHTGNGVTKVFSFAHNATSIPISVIVQAQSADAMGSFTTTWDSTNITITYPFAPPSNVSGNMVLSWIAIV